MLTDVVDAKPEIVFAGLFAGITCFMSNPIVVFAGIDTAGTTSTPSIDMVHVEIDVAAFEITMLVTVATADVLDTV